MPEDVLVSGDCLITVHLTFILPSSICIRTWGNVDAWGHGSMQMCRGMGGYRYMRTWEDVCVRAWGNVDAWGHGSMQMCRDMGGYRCMRTLDAADV